MNLSELSVGMVHEFSTSFSEEQVKQFAELSFDKNPIHLDSEYAAQTIFKKPIVHGILCSSLISAIIANHLPGNGSIYKEQTLNFLKPVFIDEVITARVSIVDIIREKGIVILETIVYKESMEVPAIIGKAVIKKLEL